VPTTSILFWSDILPPCDQKNGISNPTKDYFGEKTLQSSHIVVKKTEVAICR